MLKKLSIQVIVKTRFNDDEQIKTTLMSKTKNDFIDDCIQRGTTESDVLRNIIKLHYEIVEAFPNLKGKEFKDIKLFMLTSHSQR
jgi:hypothetical protein